MVEVRCLGCDVLGLFHLGCPTCKKDGKRSLFCTEACFSRNWESHSKDFHPKKVVAQQYVHQRSSPIFLTEGCRVALETKRLDLRAVVLTDANRIYAVKSEILVSKTQLYGTVTRSSVTFFVDNYTYGSIPAFSQSAGARMRYVFAIVPKKDSNGIALVEGKSSKARNELDADGYIGNIAIDIENGRHRPASSLFLVEGEKFLYPSAKDLQNVTASIFYEIHPSFWNQKIMTEAITTILRFAFSVLLLPSIRIDPRSNNLASILLAKRFGGEFQGPDFRHGVAQDVYLVKREKWFKDEETREGGNLEGKEGKGGQAVCRWCMVPDRKAEITCQNCDWACFCTSECRKADKSYVKGHKC